MTRETNRIGETNINNAGWRMTIIAYRNCADIDVQFEDRTIVRHKQYDAFRRGSIQHPRDKKFERSGEMAVNSQGLKMYIVEYFSATDITVGFEDGTLVRHKTYGNFKRGLVRNPNYK